MKRLKTYQGKGAGLFYVVSAGNVYRADCYSKGFTTRKEAQNFKNSVLAFADSAGIPLWEAHKLPQFWPDNGRPTKGE